MHDQSIAWLLNGVIAIREDTVKLSTRVRYGTRALVEIALNRGGGALSVTTIAQRQDLSVKYLEQIMASLKKAGIVVSMAGVHGGYKLARPPSEIRMDAVYNALEGEAWLVHCLDNPDLCDHSDACATRPLWKRMTKQLVATLESTTLTDLVPQSDSGADSA